MKYRSLKKSNIKISAISFGSWAIGGWMWGGADEVQALEAIDAAFDFGITSFDTAPVYGFGRSEELIGKALKNKRDKVQILTKYGLSWNIEQGSLHYKTEDLDGKKMILKRLASKERIIKECEESLKRLKTDYIDLYQIHWPDPLTPIEETMDAVNLLLKQGKIRAAGVSNYSAEELNKAEESINISSNQVPYSMLNKEIEKTLVDYCISNDISILAYSPLQRGILTGKITDNYRFNKGDHRPETIYYKKENIKIINKFLKEIAPIAEKYNLSTPQLVINWTAHRKGITSVLVGARNKEQVSLNSSSLDIEIEKTDFDIINNFLKNLELKT